MLQETVQDLKAQMYVLGGKRRKKHHTSSDAAIVSICVAISWFIKGQHQMKL